MQMGPIFYFMRFSTLEDFVRPMKRAIVGQTKFTILTGVCLG
jgi:hypothetical protein